MAYLISVLSFVMAFGAIWFTSEAAKRNDMRGKALLKPHIGVFEEALQRSDARIKELERRLAASEREIKILRAKDAATVEREDPMPEALMPPASGFRPSQAYNA